MQWSEIPYQDWQIGSMTIQQSLLPPTGAFHSTAQYFLCTVKKVWKIHPRASKPGIFSFKKNTRTKHLYILCDSSYFPLMLLGSVPLFSFFALRAPTFKLRCPQAQPLLLSIVVLIKLSSLHEALITCQHTVSKHLQWNSSGSKGAAIIPM